MSLKWIAIPTLMAAFSTPAVGETSYLILKPVAVSRTTGNVQQPSSARITLAEGTLPLAYVGQQYLFDFSGLTTASGGEAGTAIVQYSLVSGYLPNGLSLRNDGVIIGRPSRGYVFENPFTIRATFAGASTERSYVLRVGS